VGKRDFVLARTSTSTNVLVARWGKLSTCLQFSKFHICKISSQNYAASKQKPYKIVRMKIFTMLDETKPNTGNLRGLNLKVKRTTV